MLTGEHESALSRGVVDLFASRERNGSEELCWTEYSEVAATRKSERHLNMAKLNPHRKMLKKWQIYSMKASIYMLKMRGPSTEAQAQEQLANSMNSLLFINRLKIPRSKPGDLNKCSYVLVCCWSGCKHNFQSEFKMDLGIMDLPAEIRTSIFKWLPQPTVVHKLRLVCKQWRDEIDNLCEFAIDLDDRKPYWERMLDLRVRHCKIIHFLEPPPSGPGTTILKHVNVVRVLKISEHISPSNLYYLIGDCCKSLVSLRFHIGAYLLGYDWPSRFSTFNFQRLESLHIDLSTVLAPGASSSSQFLSSSDTRILEDLFLDLLNYRFRRLKSLKVKIDCWGFGQVSKFLSAVLACVANHSATLALLDTELNIGHGLPTAEVRPIADSDFARINFAELKSIKRLELLRLVSSSPIGITLLLDLLDQQTALNFLEVAIFPAPMSLFNSCILRNNCTLTSVEITELVVWDDEGYCNPFNIEVLSTCCNLKKLILDRNCTRRRVFDTAEIINLFSLPPGLEELALNYFNLLTDELLLFCASECGQQLRIIYLTQCGSRGDYGVDGTVLEKIIEMPLVNFIEISTLNRSNPEERDKLSMILETFGYSEDHSYFQLTKRTQSVPIKFHAYFLESDEHSEEAFVGGSD